jgi:flagellar biosynthesis anti-sigma factor FlgM
MESTAVAINSLMPQIVGAYGGPRAILRPVRDPPGPVGGPDPPEAAASGEDSVSVSTLARDLPRAAGLTRASADVRPARIARLRDELRNGTFQVNVELLAGRLEKVLRN